MAFRRLVLLVLLLTVPFQAAFGASGLLCAAGTHHDQRSPPAAHAHDAVSMHAHHHDVTTDHGADEVVTPAAAHDLQPMSGKCKTCSECCSTAAPVPAAMAAIAPPDTPLLVSPKTEPGLVSRPGDSLFRPPRTTSV